MGRLHKEALHREANAWDRTVQNGKGDLNRTSNREAYRSSPIFKAGSMVEAYEKWLAENEEASNIGKQEYRIWLADPAHNDYRREWRESHQSEKTIS